MVYLLVNKFSKKKLSKIFMLMLPLRLNLMLCGQFSPKVELAFLEMNFIRLIQTESQFQNSLSIIIREEKGGSVG
jgi:hypothetical protein